MSDLVLAFAAIVYAQTIEELCTLSEVLNLPQVNNWKNRIIDKIRPFLKTGIFKFVSTLLSS